MVAQSPGFALVLSGGGARGAYQVGVLRILAREFPEAVPDILTGVSAGGINAAFLAARPEPYQQKIDELAEMWSHLRIDEVFSVDLGSIGWRMLRWAAGWFRAASRRYRPPRAWWIPSRCAKCSSASCMPPTARSRVSTRRCATGGCARSR